MFDTLCIKPPFAPAALCFGAASLSSRLLRSSAKGPAKGDSVLTKVGGKFTAN